MTIVLMWILLHVKQLISLSLSLVTASLLYMKINCVKHRFYSINFMLTLLVSCIGNDAGEAVVQIIWRSFNLENTFTIHQ